jgi:hypothetical protein
VIYLKGSLLGLLMFCYAAIFIPTERWPLLATKQPPDASWLINASKLGDIELMKSLLAQGADVNAADEEGVTPLIAASSYRQRPAVKLLLSRGANRSAQTNEGFIAYDFAKFDDELAAILAIKKAPR